MFSSFFFPAINLRGGDSDIIISDAVLFGVLGGKRLCVATAGANGC